MRRFNVYVDGKFERRLGKKFGEGEDEAAWLADRTSEVVGGVATIVEVDDQGRELTEQMIDAELRREAAQRLGLKEEAQKWALEVDSIRGKVRGNRNG